MVLVLDHVKNYRRHTTKSQSLWDLCCSTLVGLMSKKIDIEEPLPWLLELNTMSKPSFQISCQSKTAIFFFKFLFIAHQLEKSNQNLSRRIYEAHRECPREEEGPSNISGTEGVLLLGRLFPPLSSSHPNPGGVKGSGEKEMSGGRGTTKCDCVCKQT